MADIDRLRRLAELGDIDAIDQLRREERRLGILAVYNCVWIRYDSRGDFVDRHGRRFDEGDVFQIEAKSYEEAMQGAWREAEFAYDRKEIMLFPDCVLCEMDVHNSRHDDNRIY